MLYLVHHIIVGILQLADLVPVRCYISVVKISCLRFFHSVSEPVERGGDKTVCAERDQQEKGKTDEQNDDGDQDKRSVLAGEQMIVDGGYVIPIHARSLKF